MTRTSPLVSGTAEPGYEPVASTFATQLATMEIGASFALYHQGRRVVHLWGGLADRGAGTPWREDTRAVVFSVTKGLTAMALMLLADRGKLAWDAPVASVWPGFGVNGKEAITFRTLFNHRGGLPVLDEPLTLAECCDPRARDRVTAALERQRPIWEPDADQGYHALTYGLWATEVFERLAGEPIGPFLARELFAPLGADVSLGTPPEIDARIARLVAPSAGERASTLARDLLDRARGRRAHPVTEARVARTLLAKDSLPRRAFENPSGPRGITSYDDPSVWRAALPWASATATADGVARAYLPWSLGGEHEGRRYVRAETLAPVYERQGWSERDRVLQKPLGWSQGFLKEEPHTFSPTRESFGHAGVGGALGWCDPVQQLAWGYVPNRLDPHVRSPRAVALCQAIYACPAVRDARARA